MDGGSGGKLRLSSFPTTGRWRAYYPFAFDGVMPERISLTRLTMALRKLTEANHNVWDLLGSLPKIEIENI